MRTRMRKIYRDAVLLFPKTCGDKADMAGVKKAVRRSRSGPQSQSNSTDVVILPATVGTLCGVGNQRFSFRARAMHRTSRPMNIDMDSPEWEKKVMNSWPKKCTFVVREILMTERAYIASLEEIILVSALLHVL